MTALQPGYEEDHVTQRGRRGGGRIATILGSFLFAIVFIGFGTFQLWVQHSGTPLQVTVVSCETRGTSPYYKHGPLVYFTRLFHKTSCVGQPSGAPGQQSIKIVGAQSGDVGHVIDVHLMNHGKFAQKPARWRPLIEIGIGCVVAVVGVWAVLPARRRPPNATTETAM
jgi:hypothetical protein